MNLMKKIKKCKSDNAYIQDMEMNTRPNGNPMGFFGRPPLKI